VDLVYQRFRHPVYQQNSGRGFVPGLSIIDVLMNCGFRVNLVWPRKKKTHEW